MMNLRWDADVRRKQKVVKTKYLGIHHFLTRGGKSLWKSNPLKKPNLHAGISFLGHGYFSRGKSKQRLSHFSIVSHPFHIFILYLLQAWQRIAWDDTAGMASLIRSRITILQVKKTKTSFEQKTTPWNSAWGKKFPGKKAPRALGAIRQIAISL